MSIFATSNLGEQHSPPHYKDQQQQQQQLHYKQQQQQQQFHEPRLDYPVLRKSGDLGVRYDLIPFPCPYYYIKEAHVPVRTVYTHPPPLLSDNCGSK